ncbi:MAG: thioesterase family protein [bacterium]
MDIVDKIILKNTCQIRVRYAETDKMGIVYNGNYLTYFEVARVELMRQTGLPYPEFEKAGYQLPLVESHVNYYSSAFFDDLLNIEALLNFEMKPVLKINYNIFRDNTTITTGYTVHSYFNNILKKAVRPPKIFVDAIIEASKIKK